MTLTPTGELKGLGFQFVKQNDTTNICKGKDSPVNDGKIIVDVNCITDGKENSKVAHVYFYEKQIIQTKELSFKVTCKNGFGTVDKVADEIYDKVETKVDFKIEMTISKISESASERAGDEAIMVGDRMQITLTVDENVLKKSCEKLECGAVCMVAPISAEKDLGNVNEDDYKKLSEYDAINYEEDENFDENKITMRFDAKDVEGTRVSPKNVRRIKQTVQKVL
ncbi:hypothetical protein SNEBB_004417 [Seison nebaliae]|nr:hypothetical protein SNEBB_004417 [Seison nebaliae]